MIQDPDPVRRPGTAEHAEGIVHLRPPLPGDLGWIVSRHGAFYAETYGWSQAFEALVAEIVASFGLHHDPGRERLWIAELDGARVGSIMLVTHPDDPDVAKLRIFYVEPSARGRGIGQRLIDECIRFAREAGYARVVLWTEDVLTAARRIYLRTGFTLISASPNDAFGAHSVSETWELTL